MQFLSSASMSSRLSFQGLSKFASALGLVGLMLTISSPAQNKPEPKETVRDGYAVHQSIDMGGHIADENGNPGMYNTLVNMHSGARILEQSLEMHAVTGAKHFFLYDRLLLTSSGYGGDPENSTRLRMSKGKAYDFQGLFRRDREYFDYNLLGNPLIPAGVISNGYTFPQVQHAAHLFNTVRRMTDTDLTLFPLASVTYRAGYSQNVNQGPSYSSFHNGGEARFLQNWRYSTDAWFGAFDWKPMKRTVLTFQENITHYKGNTSYQLAGPFMQLENGKPVTLGYDQVTAPSCGDGNPAILDATTTPPTVNPTCSGYQQFARSAPVRTLFPTEEFRFQTGDIKNVQMNGRIRYTGATMKLPQFHETFLGLDNFGIRSWDITGYSKAQRINVSGDLGMVWQLAPRVSVAEQFDFWNFRQPADNVLQEVDRLDDVNPNTPSMLDAPGAAQPPVVTTAHNFLGQKTITNTVTLGWKATSRASFSLGYRYKARTIRYAMPLVTDFLANGTAYTVNIHDNAGLLGAVFHPTSQWKIDGTVEAGYADNAYVQLDPRQSYRYQVHTMYSPGSLVTITGAFDDVERRNGQALVNHVDHNRSLGVGADISPNEHYGLALNYGYVDAYTRTGICFSSTAPPLGASPTAPADCGTNTYLGSGFYDEPTQYVSMDVMLSPGKKLQSHVGYRINAVNGSTEYLNPRQVPGSLRSHYQTPFGNVRVAVARNWALRGEWNYYDYSEAGQVGPTLPRDFQTNLYTLGIHYEF